MSSKKLESGSPSKSSGKKRIRIEDDDFEDACVVRTDNTDTRGTKNPRPDDSDENFESLSHRTTPKTLIDAIVELNDVQKRAIYEMGFGSVFNIAVREIPCRLAYWCVDSFRARSCSFILPGGKTLHISDKDVWLALGFPRGGRDIVRNPTFQRNKLVDRWAAEVGKKKNDSLPSDVIRCMLSDLEGGNKFKRNFLVLLEFCLIEGPAEGHVRPKIVDDLQDLTHVQNLNWSKYLLTTLIHCHENWNSTNRRRFTGSVLS